MADINLTIMPGDPDYIGLCQFMGHKPVNCLPDFPHAQPWEVDFIPGEGLMDPNLWKDPWPHCRN